MPLLCPQEQQNKRKTLNEALDTIDIIAYKRSPAGKMIPLAHLAVAG
jgi:hypothetical protein